MLGYPGIAPSLSKADSSVSPTPTYLVVIMYDDWGDLQRLAPLRLNLLDRREDRLAAMVTSYQLNTLRNMGFEVHILDTIAAPEEPAEAGTRDYYLVTPSPGAQIAALNRHGQVIPYAKSLFILKAGPAEAERLPVEGFFIQKLLGPIAWPTSGPSPAVDAPPLMIQEHDPLIQGLVNSVSQTQIYTTILELQDDDAVPGWDALRSRYSYAPELAIERDYIRDRMQALDLNVQYQSFSLNGDMLDNVEGTLEGWEPGSDVVYIASAHYDSISDDPDNAAPGADDNASGTAGVLEAARVLSRYRYRHTLRFVAFSAEEQGLIGSYYYASAARSAGTAIGGVINLDMIGWDSNSDDVMEIHAGPHSDSQALGNAFGAANDVYGISLEPQYFTLGALPWSDHASFWNQDYPAILIIEDSPDFNPYYHKTTDTLDKLDLPYATKFVQTTVATLAELAEIIPPGLNVEHNGPDWVTTGTLITLTIQYANPGPEPAMGVMITDTLSPGLSYVVDSSGFTVTQPASGTLVWQVGGVAPHTRRSFVVTTSVEASLPAGTHLTSTVDITGVTTWDDPADNQDIWTGSVPYLSLYLPVVFKNTN
jgi:uncharacterized repeat protein (TIGR01451 family)